MRYKILALIKAIRWALFASGLYTCRTILHALRVRQMGSFGTRAGAVSVSLVTALILILPGHLSHAAVSCQTAYKGATETNSTDNTESTSENTTEAVQITKAEQLVAQLKSLINDADMRRTDIDISNLLTHELSPIFKQNSTLIQQKVEVFSKLQKDDLANNLFSETKESQTLLLKIGRSVSFGKNFKSKTLQWLNRWAARKVQKQVSKLNQNNEGIIKLLQSLEQENQNLAAVEQSLRAELKSLIPALEQMRLARDILQNEFWYLDNVSESDPKRQTLKSTLLGFDKEISNTHSLIAITQALQERVNQHININLKAKEIGVSTTTADAHKVSILAQEYVDLKLNSRYEQVEKLEKIKPENLSGNSAAADPTNLANIQLKSKYYKWEDLEKLPKKSFLKDLYYNRIASREDQLKYFIRYLFENTQERYKNILAHEKNIDDYITIDESYLEFSMSSEFSNYEAYQGKAPELWPEDYDVIRNSVAYNFAPMSWNSFQKNISYGWATKINSIFDTYLIYLSRQDKLNYRKLRIKTAPHNSDPSWHVQLLHNIFLVKNFVKNKEMSALDLSRALFDLSGERADQGIFILTEAEYKEVLPSIRAIDSVLADRIEKLAERSQPFATIDPRFRSPVLDFRNEIKRLMIDRSVELYFENLPSDQAQPTDRLFLPLASIPLQNKILKKYFQGIENKNLTTKEKEEIISLSQEQLDKYANDEKRRGFALTEIQKSYHPMRYIFYKTSGLQVGIDTPKFLYGHDETLKVYGFAKNSEAFTIDGHLYFYRLDKDLCADFYND